MRSIWGAKHNTPLTPRGKREADDEKNTITPLRERAPVKTKQNHSHMRPPAAERDPDQTKSPLPLGGRGQPQKTTAHSPFWRTEDPPSMMVSRVPVLVLYPRQPPPGRWWIPTKGSSRSLPLPSKKRRTNGTLHNGHVSQRPSPSPPPPLDGS